MGKLRLRKANWASIVIQVETWRRKKEAKFPALLGGRPPTSAAHTHEGSHGAFLGFFHFWVSCSQESSRNPTGLKWAIYYSFLHILIWFITTHLSNLDGSLFALFEHFRQATTALGNKPIFYAWHFSRKKLYTNSQKCWEGSIFYMYRVLLSLRKFPKCYPLLLHTQNMFSSYPL